MKIYVPMYDYGKKIAVIESENAVYRKTPGADAAILHQGIIYNGERIFSSREGVIAYWNYDNNGMKESEIREENIKWQRKY